MEERENDGMGVRWIKTKDGKEIVIKVEKEKMPNSKLLKWQSKVEDVILSFIFVGFIIFVIYLFSMTL